MPFLLYDYVNSQGVNEFQAWTQRLQTKQIARLNEKLDKLECYGQALFPHMLCGTKVAGIMKLRVHGGVQLRPMLCAGPVAGEDAFTLLAGATERDAKLVPNDVEMIADARKSEVKKDPMTRRVSHVRITKKAD